jgi:hypothetical protein
MNVSLRLLGVHERTGDDSLIPYAHYIKPLAERFQTATEGADCQSPLLD